MTIRVNKILNKIALHDLPEILALVNKKIKFDIVGNLPIEVVALVFGYLDLEDVLRLQIVSRRWKTVLSSDVVQCAPIHAPTRWLQERYALDPANFLKKRLRIQNGIFLTRVLLSPLLQVENLWATSADYSEGHFAWIDWSSRVLNMLNLWTGQLVKFTTEERQEFKETRVSNVLAVAISRQTCHVWHIHLHEYACFQLPNALCEGRFFVYGTKVMLLCGKHLIHWSFESRTAHTIHWEDASNLKVLALDKNDDGFTVVYNPQIPPSPSSPNIAESLDQRIESREMHIEHFALENGVFQSTSKQIETFPPAGWAINKDGPGHSHNSCPLYTLYPGQCSFNPEIVTCSNFDMFAPSSRRDLFYLNLISLENGQDVVYHHLRESDILEFSSPRPISPSPGIIYASQCQCPDVSICVISHPIIFERSNSAPGSIRSYFSRTGRIDLKCNGIYGDEDFIILVDRDCLAIQSFNGRGIWDPDAIEWPHETRRREWMEE
ncbi:hypothetical protein VI817_009591 [Penicillium citrinum]|nr:hypothetical protein VI817_009591 [Penicillium citrinum]